MFDGSASPKLLTSRASDGKQEKKRIWIGKYLISDLCILHLGNEWLVANKGSASFIDF